MITFKKLPRPEVLVVLAYLGAAVIGLRKLLFTPGVIGHNWDWSIPVLSEYLKEMFKDAPFIWSDFSLGQLSIFQLDLIPFHYFLTLWGFLGFSGEFVSKFLSLLTVLLAGTTMFLLTKDILNEKISPKEGGNVLPSAFLAGLFYGFSPYLFQELIGGATTSFFAYALFPLAILFFRRQKIFLTALLLFILTASLQVLLLAAGFLFLYSLIYRQNLKHFLLISFLTALFNLYWLIPLFFLAQEGFASGAVTTGDLIATVKNSVPSLGEIFIATGYFRPLFTMSIIPEVKPFWSVVAYLLVILIVFGANLVLAGKRRPLFWLAFLLFSFIPATGGKSPLGGLVIWLYQNFPLMALFRSPQHFLLWPTFAFALLLGTGIFFLLGRLAPSWAKMKVVIVFIFLGITIWLHPFLLYGDLGAQQLKTRFGGGNFVDVYRLSPDFQKILQFLAKTDGDFRVLVLPMTATPYYLPSRYQSIGQGGDPQLFRAPKPMVVADFVSAKLPLSLLEETERKIYLDQDRLFFENFLALANIQYVILRKDVVPNFGFGAGSWDYEQIKNFLEQTPFLAKVSEGQLVTLYAVDKRISFSHFYLPQRTFLTQGKPEDSLEMASLENLVDKPTVYLAEGKAKTRTVTTHIPIRVLLPALSTTPFTEEVFYPYVRLKPDSLFYPYVLAKESWLERQEKDLARLFDLKLFFAAKRINEISKWVDRLSSFQLEEISKRHYQKMVEALMILEQIKKEQEEKIDWRYLLSKYERYLGGNFSKLEEVLSEKVESEQGQKVISLVFADLWERMERIKKQEEDKQGEYLFNLTRGGVYEFFLKERNFDQPSVKELTREMKLEVDGEEVLEKGSIFGSGWMKVGQRFLNEGDHRFSFWLPPPKNLVEGEVWEELKGGQAVRLKDSQISLSFLPKDSLPSETNARGKQIKEYTPSRPYQISLDYQAINGQAGVTVIEETEVSSKEKKKGKTYTVRANVILPETQGKESLKRFVITFLSGPRAVTGKIYLLAAPNPDKFSEISFSNVRVEHLIEPKIFARLQEPPIMQESLPDVSAIKISPVKYQLTVKQAKEPYTLVFSESFHPGWKLYPEGSKSPISEEKHRLVNGYANAWEVKKEDTGGKENYDLIVEFAPQRLFYQGLVLSIISFLFSTGFFLWRKLRKISPPLS